MPSRSWAWPDNLHQTWYLWNRFVVLCSFSLPIYVCMSNSILYLRKHSQDLRPDQIEGSIAGYEVLYQKQNQQHRTIKIYFHIIKVPKSSKYLNSKPPRTSKSTISNNPQNQTGLKSHIPTNNPSTPPKQTQTYPIRAVKITSHRDIPFTLLQHHWWEK